MSNLSHSESAKHCRASWYQRIPPHDRLVVDAVAKWLRPVPWQWFLTITFPWNVRSETAVHKLCSFINELERFSRANACFVAGQESKPRQCGVSVPNHFHLLLASHATLPREAVEALCFAQITHRPSQGRNRESVHAEHYNSDQRGPEYCLKAINDSHGDWFIHRLELFLPGAVGPSKPNHRSVRNDRRSREQATRLASASDPESPRGLP